MTKFFRTISFLLWALGLIATVVAVIWRLVPHGRFELNVEMRSVLLLAAVFFLGAIATWAMGQSSAR